MKWLLPEEETKIAPVSEVKKTDWWELHVKDCQHCRRAYTDFLAIRHTLGPIIIGLTGLMALCTASRSVPGVVVSSLSSSCLKMTGLHEHILNITLRAVHVSSVLPPDPRRSSRALTFQIQITAQV